MRDRVREQQVNAREICGLGALGRVREYCGFLLWGRFSSTMRVQLHQFGYGRCLLVFLFVM